MATKFWRVSPSDRLSTINFIRQNSVESIAKSDVANDFFDTAAAAVTGTAASSQVQTSASTGTATSSGFTGTASSSQAQSAAATGTTTPAAAITGTASASQAQTSAATGTYTAAPSISGSAATSQAQTSSASGTRTPAPAISGTASGSQAQTTALAGTNTAAGVISGAASSSQAQTSSSLGEVTGGTVLPPPARGGVGGRKVYERERPRTRSDEFMDELRAPFKAVQAPVTPSMPSPKGVVPSVPTAVASLIKRSIQATQAVSAPFLATPPPVVQVLLSDDEIPDEVYLLAAL